MSLQLEHLTRNYGAVVAVDGVSFTLPAGQTLGLIGPSGSGKSTLLRLVAGLEAADGGRILQSGRDLVDKPARLRNFGVVFQDYALFPHLDVTANIAFGLVERRWSRERMSLRIAELLELVGLAGLGTRRVEQLSGGQQQRVALARALAPDPQVLLLDEPLSNLDANLRRELTAELAALLDNPQLSAIHVTHDQSEAFRLADMIGVLKNGELVQYGRAQQVLERPRNPWVARFLGYRNVYTAPRPLLLDEGLVSISGQDGQAGHGLAATVASVVAYGSSFELALLPDGWEQPLHWSGHTRETGMVPASGDRLWLDIPERAWRQLESE